MKKDFQHLFLSFPLKTYNLNSKGVHVILKWIKEYLAKRRNE